MARTFTKLCAGYVKDQAGSAYPEKYRAILESKLAETKRDHEAARRWVDTEYAANQYFVHAAFGASDMTGPAYMAALAEIESFDAALAE